MLSVEATGKNIEQAIENALLELKAPREDVDIKILNEGGLFKKAKVLVSISQDAREKYEKKSKFRERIDNINAKKIETQIEKFEGLTISERKEKLSERLKEIMSEDDKVDEVENKLEVEEENKACKKTTKEEKVVDPFVFLQGYFKAMGKSVEIKVEEDDKYQTFSVEGEDLGEAIGHRGEAFYALHNILQTVAGKQEKRILLDVDNYRAKREESLVATAHRIAKKVAKSGRYYKLEPMKPAERRVIHAALADDDSVTTLSKGTEPHRYVIIFPKEYKDR